MEPNIGDIVKVHDGFNTILKVSEDNLNSIINQGFTPANPREIYDYFFAQKTKYSSALKKIAVQYDETGWYDSGVICRHIAQEALS
jgi:hypothetical protein